MKKLLAAIAAATMLGAGLLAPAVTAQATTGCPTVHWGSLAKSVPAAPSGATLVTNVRSGRHACFDRLVIDLFRGTPAATVQYVSQVRGDASGRVVPLRGGAFLHVVLSGVSTPVDAGHPGYRPANRSELVDVSGYRTLRQVASAEGFEGYDTYGVGVRARLPFQVFRLGGPGGGSRLVIDVAHTW